MMVTFAHGIRLGGLDTCPSDRSHEQRGRMTGYYKLWISAALQALAVCALASSAASQTPTPALLILEKEDKSLAIADPATLKVVARAPAGEDPHEIVVNQGSSRAYISNYGAFRTPQHTLSVVDLVSQKPLPPVDL